LLYWYKSTDAEAAAAQVWCMAATSVYLLYWKKSTGADWRRSGVWQRHQFTSLTGKKVQILTQLRRRSGVWQRHKGVLQYVRQVLSLLALLVQKYKD
jgi:hypothetical protein